MYGMEGPSCFHGAKALWETGGKASIIQSPVNLSKPAAHLRVTLLEHFPGTRRWVSTVLGLNPPFLATVGHDQYWPSLHFTKGEAEAPRG